MFYAVLLICVLFAAALWFAVVYLPSRLLHPPRHLPEFWRGSEPFVTPQDAGLAFEEIALHTRDGLTLAAWFLPATGPVHGTVIYLHGIGGSRVTTIAGASMFCAHGYHVFTYDARAAGISEGNECTYGFHEREDVSAAIDYLATRSDVDIRKFAVLGKSLGGAIALQAAAKDPRIRCVIAEAAFTDLYSITSDYQRRLYGTGARLLNRVAMWCAERRAGFHAADVSPVTAVASCETPVFFIHGADDPLVSAAYSQQLFDAARGPKELWIIPGGGHGALFKIAGEAYNTRRLNFLERYLT